MAKNSLLKSKRQTVLYCSPHYFFLMVQFLLWVMRFVSLQAPQCTESRCKMSTAAPTKGAQVSLSLRITLFPHVMHIPSGLVVCASAAIERPLMFPCHVRLWNDNSSRLYPRAHAHILSGVLNEIQLEKNVPECWSPDWSEKLQKKTPKKRWIGGGWSTGGHVR